MTELKVEMQRDSKVVIYMYAVIGIALFSVGLAEIIHTALDHQMITTVDWLAIFLLIIIGLFCIYKAFQLFREKYHNFALAMAKKT